MIFKLPSPSIFKLAVNNFNEETITESELAPLVKNWPKENQYEELLQLARDEPENDWDEVEEYLIELGEATMFDKKINVWLFKYRFDKKISNV